MHAGDDTARVWDLLADDPNTSSIALRPGGDATISPDGRWVVTGGRLWDLDFESALQRAQSVVGRDLTEAEREQYSIDKSENRDGQ